MYFITPSSKKIERALESWHWIGLEDCEALSITAFGDIFFRSANGIKFLDTLEGVLKMVASDEDDLQQ
jgi:hypothetical protein